MKIEKANSLQYEAIQRFLEDVYGLSAKSFREGWPQLWKETYTEFNNILIMKEKEQIVALTRIFPLKYIQNGAIIKSAGIGSVSTLFSHRGKGYMSKLLESSFLQMKEEQFPISILWGDRHRYGFFGYENCGSCVRLDVEVRGLTKCGVKKIEAKRFFGEGPILEKMMKSYNLHKYKKDRTVEDFKIIYGRRGRATYYTEKDGNFAYIILPSMEAAGQGNIKEFGGNPELLLGMLLHFSDRFGTNAFKFTFPSLQDIPDIIFNSNSGTSIGNTCKLKIINLKDTLTSFVKQSGFYFPDGEEVTLTIKNKESVTISKPDGVLLIKETKGKNEVILSEQEMVRLLFGLTFWVPATVDTQTERLLKGFLPFKFFVWPTDTV